MELPPYINSLKGELEWGEGHKIKAAVELMQPSLLSPLRFLSFPPQTTNALMRSWIEKIGIGRSGKPVFCDFPPPSESIGVGGPIIESEETLARTFPRWSSQFGFDCMNQLHWVA